MLRERPSNPCARGCRYEWPLTSSLALGRVHCAGNKTGRVKQDPARMIVFVRDWNVPSAGAATSDGPAATATTAAATTAAASPAAAATAATAAAPPGNLLARLGFCGVFLVEDVECRQAHVRDFFLAEEDFVTRRCILGQRIRHLSGGRCGSSARRGQRNAGDPQNGDGLTPTLSLGSLFRIRHFIGLPYVQARFSRMARKTYHHSYRFA